MDWNKIYGLELDSELIQLLDNNKERVIDNWASKFPELVNIIAVVFPAIVFII